MVICLVACDHLRPCNSFLTYSFFSCKDRALERDRPYQRKKKIRPTDAVAESWCPLPMDQDRVSVVGSAQPKWRAMSIRNISMWYSIQHTHVVSPLDMAGMIGMAQTLAVYHYGYPALKARQIQFMDGPALVPSDTAAVLDWGLDTPFTSLDKPLLSIAMIVTVNGELSTKIPLVIGQKSKLRLTPEVTAALASQSRDHRLTASGFFPCSVDTALIIATVALPQQSSLSSKEAPRRLPLRNLTL